jgi:hypothetical protein
LALGAKAEDNYSPVRISLENDTFKTLSVQSLLPEGELRIDNSEITEAVSLPSGKVWLDSGGIVADTMKSNLNIDFSHTAINAKFSSDLNFKNVLTPNYKSKLFFEYCSLGEKTNFADLHTDTIVFKDCYIENDIFLPTSTSPLYLDFIDCDVSKIKFNYTDNINLFFERNSSDDFILGTYETLLNKFKLEGKLQSYKRLDIEYSQYKYHKSMIGTVVNAIDFVWCTMGIKSG